MRPRKPVPRLWLMTDERMGNRLWPALRALPPGSGVVLRHRATGTAERRRLILRVRRLAHARRLILSVAGGAVGAGAHNSDDVHAPVRTLAVHSRRDAIRACRHADVFFVSPVFATRSHSGAAGIGPARAAAMGRGSGAAVMALGGMDRRRFLRIRHHGFDGWAAIDALHPTARDQKRKAVPT